MKPSPLLILAAALCTPLQLLAWGQKGHDVVAAVAQRHLTPAARCAVDSLLKGKSMVYWANWLDNASHTPDYDYSRTWHYKNIDPQYTYAEAPQNPKGDVVTAINEQITTLSGISAGDKSLALKMLIHLVGDLHQPMHMGRAADRGGNKHQVQYFGRGSNLHSVWDTSLLESAHKWGYGEWADQIDIATPPAYLISGNPDTWGEETYEIAKEVYADTPSGADLSYDYVARWAPVIEGQLLKGGLRLATLLNSLW